jgi:hypothetical protein
MQCRSCGTRIADKAIVCFRCGTPTMEPAAGREAGRGVRRERPSLRVPVTAGLLAAAIFGVGYYLGDWVRGLLVAVAVEGAITGWWAWRLRTTSRPSGID